jgi:hypothetical protein
MTTLVIGGDRIDSIRRELAEHGLEDIEHWGGRKPADARRAIPSRVELVVMVTDQLSHNMLYNATIRATRLGLPIVHCRRSAVELRAKLAQRFCKRSTQQTRKTFGPEAVHPERAFADTFPGQARPA